MTVATELLHNIFSEAPGEQSEASLPQACLSDIADPLDWTELLDALVSDFALALTNGETQYMQGVGDLMGRMTE